MALRDRGLYLLAGTFCYERRADHWSGRLDFAADVQYPTGNQSLPGAGAC